MIKIVSCFWNASDYIEKCIMSVKNQTHKEFKMFLIDDISSDKTVEIIKNIIDGDDRFVLIKNDEKKYKLKNLDNLLSDENLINDEDIIVELDGDDWLYNNKVLEFIYNKYNSNTQLWLTNGSFIYSTGSVGFSKRVNHRTIRNDVFSFSHLRTWKSHLWRSIDKTSFMDQNGEYFKSAPDVAYSFPMVELSGDDHYEFINDILLVYNAESPFNEHKDGASAGKNEQERCANIIRKLPKYNPII